MKDFYTKLKTGKHAKGKILIVGFGWGYATKNLIDRKDVSEVTTVEISQDNINSAKDKVKNSNKHTFVNKDLREYKTTKKYDFIYIDIFNDSTEEFFGPVRDFIPKVVGMLKNEGRLAIEWQGDIPIENELRAYILDYFDEDEVEHVVPIKNGSALRSQSGHIKYYIAK